jgi:hypothetical protein
MAILWLIFALVYITLFELYVEQGWVVSVVTYVASSKRWNERRSLACCSLLEQAQSVATSVLGGDASPCGITRLAPANFLAPSVLLSRSVARAVHHIPSTRPSGAETKHLQTCPPLLFRINMWCQGPQYRATAKSTLTARPFNSFISVDDESINLPKKESPCLEEFPLAVLCMLP